MTFRLVKFASKGPFTIKRDGLALSGDQLTYNVKTKETVSEATVTEVEVKFVGPQSVEAQEIRPNIHVKVGSPFDLEAVDQDVRRLYATGHFYNVRVSKEKNRSGTKVTYIVQCNPELVEIQFKGNKAFTDVELRKVITSKIGGHPSERSLFLDAEKIQEQYKRTGLEGTIVKYFTVLDEASGKTKVTFQIVEGP